MDEEGYEIVPDLLRAKSVDIVTDPATVKGLYEEAEAEEEAAGMSVLDHAWEACKAGVCTILDEPEGTPKEKADKIHELLMHHHKLYTKHQPKEGEEAEVTTEEVQELATLRAEKNARLLCEELAVPVTKELVEALVALPDADKRKEHLQSVKKASVVEKPKSGFRTEPVGKTTSSDAPAPKNWATVLRG